MSVVINPLYFILLLSSGVAIVNAKAAEEGYKTQVSANFSIPPCPVMKLDSGTDMTFVPADRDNTSSHNCTFPPLRNNRNRRSCKIAFSRKADENYCYIDPDGLPVNCTAVDGDVSCRCGFYPKLLNRRNCQIVPYK